SVAIRPTPRRLACIANCPARSGRRLLPDALRDRQRDGRRSRPVGADRAQTCYLTGAIPHPAVRILMNAPDCRRMGRHCRALEVKLRVAVLEGQEDHDATWLLGHTERIDFGQLWVEDEELWTDARVVVPCRHLRSEGNGSVRCA